MKTKSPVSWSVINDDCVDALKQFPDDHFESLVTDPPAGIAFMNKEWDKDKGGRDQWIDWLEKVMRECHRVLKPGAHGFVWALPRTSHWTAMALENAGFEVRDVVTHLFGSGFPKSHDISKALDKKAGVEREIIGVNPSSRPNSKTKGGRGFDAALGGETAGVQNLTVPATPEAKQWYGWGTALKPASEHWILIRKPFKGTVAENVMRYSTGAINIDASRIEAKDQDKLSKNWDRETIRDIRGDSYGHGDGKSGGLKNNYNAPQGRFPSHFVMSHSPYCTDEQCDIECAVKMLDGQSGVLHPGGQKSCGSKDANSTFGIGIDIERRAKFKDKGGASRFFMCFRTEHDIETKCKNTHANNVARSLWHILATAEKFAPINADTMPNEKLVQAVKSVGIQCDSCATHIAVGLAGIKSWVFSHQRSKVFQDFIASYKNSTPIQNLASIVEKWESTGTIPTTQDLFTLFGCAQAAIEKPTKQESQSEDSDLIRFRYQAKASKRERNEGLRNKTNGHPTIKSIKLMQYLIRMVTPPGGWVLDPFTGSGSTGVAALKSGFNFQGIEKEVEYHQIAEARLRSINDYRK